MVESLYTDSNFLTANESIYGKSKERFNYSICWRRASEISPGCKLFGNTPSILDINQGDLGDCYFLSSLITLAQNPNLIKSLFVYKNKSKGKFTIHFPRFNNYVTIDDYIPCNASTNKPIFAKLFNKKLWVVLLEKAYAKLHGSYFALITYNPASALCDLLGTYAIRTNFIRDHEMITNGSLWLDLLKYSKQGYSAVVSSKSKNTQFDISPHHSFAFIKALEYGIEKLILLKNPLPKLRCLWTGPWSEKSEKWTPEAFEDLKPEFEKSFMWVAFEDFIQNFDKISVAKWQYEFQFKQQLIIKRHENGAFSEKVFEVYAENDCEIIIGVHQEDLRANGKDYWRYIDVGIIILRQNEGGFQLVQCTDKNLWERDVFLKANIEPGYYFVVILSTGVSFNYSEPITQEDFGYHYKDWCYRMFSVYFKGKQFVDFSEFSRFCESSQIQIEEAEFYQFCQESQKEGQLDVDGFLQIMNNELNTKSPEMIYLNLSSLGYDQHLNSLQSRSVNFSICCNNSLRVIPIDIDIESIAWGLYSEKISSRTLVKEKITLYKIHHQNSYAKTYVAFSNNPETKLINLAFANITNAVFAMPTENIEILSGQWQVVEHVYSLDHKSEPKFVLKLQVQN